MPKKDAFQGAEYQGYELAQKDHLYSEKHLKKNMELVDTMKARHNKVTFVRMDFRYPNDRLSDGSNKDFNRAMTSMMKSLERQHLDPQYIAKREQVGSDNPHYHSLIAVNGSRKRNRMSLVALGEHYWGMALGLSDEEAHRKEVVFPCNRDRFGNERPNGGMIKRGAADEQEQTALFIRQASYLAKRDPNDRTPSSVKKFFSSKFKQDYDMAMQRKESWKQKHLPHECSEGNDPFSEPK